MSDGQEVPQGSSKCLDRQTFLTCFNEVIWRRREHTLRAAQEVRPPNPRLILIHFHPPREAAQRLASAWRLHSCEYPQALAVHSPKGLRSRWILHHPCSHMLGSLLHCLLLSEDCGFPRAWVVHVLPQHDCSSRWQHTAPGSTASPTQTQPPTAAFKAPLIYLL